MRAVIGAGYTDRTLSTGEIRDLLTRASGGWDLAGQRVLCIIPDSTRTAPLPLMFRLLHEQLAGKVARLDFLVALGTHPPMDEAALIRLLGITPEERATRYADVDIFNHRWDLPETFVTLGTISAGETEELSQGRLSLDLPVRANRLLLAYDQILICGPVFPHEVAGFSGGNKYLFPGVSGSEVIDFTHWLGALETNDHADRQRRRWDEGGGLFDGSSHGRVFEANRMVVGLQRPQPVGKIDHFGATDAGEEVLVPPGETGHLVGENRTTDEDLVICQQQPVGPHG